MPQLNGSLSQKTPAPPIKWYLAFDNLAISSVAGERGVVDINGLADSREIDAGIEWVIRISGEGIGGEGSDDLEGGGVRSEIYELTSA